MISLPEILVSLQGAGRLALRDPSGLAFFEASPRGFWRSFTAALLVYPAFLILGAIGPNAAKLADPTYITVEAIGYIIDWVAFPLAMVRLTALIGRSNHYFGYFVAANWCEVVQMWLLATVGILGWTGLRPDGIVEFVRLVALLWALGLSWYVAKIGLEVDGITAAGIVGLDFVIGLFITSVTHAIEARAAATAVGL